MNTKQLYFALYSNKFTNPYFDGIYSSDNLEDIILRPKLIIVNTSPSNEKGSHWISFWFNSNEIDIFDSLGEINFQTYPNDIVNFIKRYSNNINFCKKAVQPKNTDICGELCLYFAFFKCLGYSLQTITKRMSDLKGVVSFVQKVFDICVSHSCHFLQSCQKCA